MARERWFYAKDMRRVGPLPQHQLVESLRALPDARGYLIWRHGLPAWTPARGVPEIDRQLAPLIKAGPEPALEPAAPSVEAGGAEPAGGHAIRVPGRTSALDARGAQGLPPPTVAPYLAGLAALLVVVVVGWLLWPRSTHHDGPNVAPGPARVNSGGPPLASPAADAAPSAEEEPGGGTSAFAGWSDQEADLPLGGLSHLRGVAGWRGDRLTITVYNGSTWRITELLVRTSQLSGDGFVDNATPQRFLPAGGVPVDPATAALLKKVAPDRRKPGVNPLDTGSFEATVGPHPEAYRWKIEGARGYPPRL